MKHNYLVALMATACIAGLLPLAATATAQLVPPGGIWDGIYNATNGGPPVTQNIGGSFVHGIDGTNMGGDGADDSVMLYRNVLASEFQSARVRISQQTSGFWSNGGVIARVANGAPDQGANEQFATAASFDVSAQDPAAFGGNGVSLQAQRIQDGLRNLDANTAGLTAADVEYVRLDYLGGGDFEAFGSNNGFIWTSYHTFNHPNISDTDLLEIGTWGSFNAAAPGASIGFDWAEIHTTNGVLRDDFNTDFQYAIPEPTSLALMGIAASLLSIGAVRRRRQ